MMKVSTYLKSELKTHYKVTFTLDNYYIIMVPYWSCYENPEMKERKIYFSSKKEKTIGLPHRCFVGVALNKRIETYGEHFNSKIENKQ